jgi:hypothetical protein
VRRRSLARALAVPVAALGIAAGAFAAPAAQAQTTNIDTSGTVALTISLSYLAQLAKAHVIVFPTPLSELSVNKTNHTATITTTVTGGDADVSVFVGSLNMSGKIHFVRFCRAAKKATLGNVQLDIGDADLVATPAGSSTPVVLLDVSGDVAFAFTPSPTNPLSATDTYSSDQLVVDPAGAAYLDSTLGTKAFKAGQTVGSVSATWTVTYPS